MRRIGLLVESAAVACMTGALTMAAFTNANSVQDKTEIEVENHGIENVEVAGIASVLNDYKLALAEERDNIVSVEREHVDMVASAGVSLDVINIESEVKADLETDKELQDGSQTDESAKDGKKKSQTEKSKTESSEQTEEELEWQDYLMADVNEYLNIRSGKSEDSEVVAKLYKGDRALIKKAGKTWTKIASGSAVGYVKNEYCVMGTDALKYAKKNCDRIATVTNDGLRVRKGQSTESSIVKRMSEGDVLTVDTSAKSKDGWVAVLLDSNTYYVSADYVTLSYQTGKAVTIEEEKAAEEAAKEAEEKKKEDASSSNVSSGTTTTQGASLAASADEVTLLAALIQCEAGGQSYECQLGVGAVVINRIKSGRFPNSMYNVIYQSGQFGPAATGKLERRLKSGVSSTALRAAEEALSGVDNTGGCLYFNVKSCGHSGTVMGAMVFY